MSLCSSPRACLQAPTLAHPEYSVLFFLHPRSTRQSLENIRQAAYEPVMHHSSRRARKNHLLQRSRDAWEKWILFARRKSGVFSRDGRWTLFAKAPNVLRGQTRLSSKSRLTLPLGLKTLLRIKLPHAIRKNTNIRNFFLLYKLLSVSFLTKKGKNLAWIMLLWNHYILWLLKKFTQYGDFF
jgi:hypothetical protein